MVQYLHFRILKFPLISHSTNSLFSCSASLPSCPIQVSRPRRGALSAPDEGRLFKTVQYRPAKHNCLRPIQVPPIMKHALKLCSMLFGTKGYRNGSIGNIGHIGNMCYSYPACLASIQALVVPIVDCTLWLYQNSYGKASFIMAKLTINGYFQ